MPTQASPSPAPARHPRRIWPWLLLVVAALGALLIWRAPWSNTAQKNGGRQASTSVGVATATTGDIPVTLNALGTVTSLATATVKSQISGYLTAIPFKEGQVVKKGDVLAQVDPRPYEVALAQYQGQLQRDQALLENARLDYKRYQQLAAQDSTSKQTVDTALATVHQYEGTVRTDQAQVDSEKLNLTYARIVSPIDGRVGLRQVDVGNYVTASDTDGVAVVTQTDPISVVFTLPEDDLEQVLVPSDDGKPRSVGAWDRTFTTQLSSGTLDTIDNQVDTSTGTVKLRALFDNPKGTLFPNQFVNATLLVRTLHGAVTIPSTAVQTGSPGTFVYQLNSDHTVALRKVTLGPSAGGRVAVTAGLAAGDVVVVDGADHLSDGAKVTVPGAATATDAGGADHAAGKHRGHAKATASAAP
ncbi:MdtA/MuxA family multidrug efflux RND transporter periplasmic adaptor subunit [Luteibacter aegosomaticola]|uniref:MdtA/MuxA family multidrug efflux RND transporter periplasmic adaptor subunit n=1 Tax=Luteibacter aegosomaticola TaxID=2911538 RepID=UPI001FFA47E1|nr:MdtA/MuxA family multidrug efflux RND transporter periplasmic adaptor subunit [Luteibacter aegosomaticola]UPG89804.1 MdtA/MuxA family multidrug efflux RND transporter periplasmic adaptor subunit [Luteibacter aegosomaticola]